MGLKINKDLTPNLFYQDAVGILTDTFFSILALARF